MRSRGRRRARPSHDNDRFALLENRRGLQLISRQIGDQLVHTAIRRKMEHAPIDSDFSRADSEEAAEIDNGRPHHAGRIDDDIDDMAQSFAFEAEHGLAEERLGRLPVNDNGRRFGGTVGLAWVRWWRFSAGRDWRGGGRWRGCWRALSRGVIGKSRGKGNSPPRRKSAPLYYKHRDRNSHAEGIPDGERKHDKASCR